MSGAARQDLGQANFAIEDQGASNVRAHSDLSIAFVSWINDELRKEQERREALEAARRRWFRSRLASHLTSFLVGALVAFLKTFE